MACGALCRIFSTRCSLPFDESFLCSFYATLHRVCVAVSAQLLVLLHA